MSCVMDRDSDKEIGCLAEERQPILEPDRRRHTLAADTAVYSRRWYILMLFCLTGFNSAMLWNTWGPITESAEDVFGWDDGSIGMLANFGNIFFMLFVLPMCWFMDEKGMRWAILISSVITCSGAGIRCISFEPTIATWTANICACLTGISGGVCYAGPALVSAVWFPPSQRGTATGIMSVSTYFGIGMSFIIGPQLVRSPIHSNTNHTHQDNGTLYNIQKAETSSRNITNIPEVTDDIKHLMYLHVGLSALCVLLNLIYFPAKPPKPPSVSASVERTDYIKGLKQLLRMPMVWLVVLAFSIPVGILQAWATVLDVNLKPLGISQQTAGYMGFWQTMAGCASGIIVSRFADIFMRRMKLFLIVMYAGGACIAAWLVVLCEQYIPLNIPSLYTAIVLVGVLVNGAIPLFFEVTCEASYPVAEGVTVGWLTLVSNVSGTAFLFILLVKSLGTSWMNWVLMGSIVIALPILCAFRESYKRTDLDLDVNVTVNVQANSDTPTTEKAQS